MKSNETKAKIAKDLMFSITIYKKITVRVPVCPE